MCFFKRNIEEANIFSRHNWLASLLTQLVLAPPPSASWSPPLLTRPPPPSLARQAGQVHDGGHTHAEKDETEVDDGGPVSRKGTSRLADWEMVPTQSVTCAAENCIPEGKVRDENTVQLVFNKTGCVRFGKRLWLTTLLRKKIWRYMLHIAFQQKQSNFDMLYYKFRYWNSLLLFFFIKSRVKGAWDESLM